MTIIDPSRGKCVVCHLRPQRNKGHRPSGERYWGQKCGGCHQKRVEENRIRRANGLPTIGVDGRETDHTGQIFNGQLVLGRGETRKRHNGRAKLTWLVRCSCGYEREVSELYHLGVHCRRCAVRHIQLRQYTDENPRPCVSCGQPAVKRTRRRKDGSVGFDKRCQACRIKSKRRFKTHAMVLYAIEAYEREGGPAKYVKFGITTNIRKRAATLQSACPLLLKVVAFEAFGNHTRLMESFVLKACRQFQARGEWLDPAEEVFMYVGALRMASGNEEHKRAMLDEAMAWDRQGRVADCRWPLIDALIEDTKMLRSLAYHAGIDVFQGNGSCDGPH